MCTIPIFNTLEHQLASYTSMKYILHVGNLFPCWVFGIEVWEYEDKDKLRISDLPQFLRFF